MSNGVLFISFLLSTLLSYSQGYHKLLQDSTVWHYSIASNMPLTTGLIYTNGDSVINGYSYQKVYNSNELMLMYEDTLAQKVYWHARTDSFAPIFPYMGCFSGTPFGELLYDFSLQIGDSTCITRLNQQPMSKLYKVDTIFYVQTLGGLRKNLRLKSISPPHYGINWIEGVGNVENLLNYKLYELWGAMADAPDYTLTCIYQNTTQIYQNPQYLDCENVVSSLAAENYQGINVYPNPIENELVISSTEVNLAKVSIKIYNSLGIEVANIISQRDKNRISLNTSSFQQGIYSYSLIDQDNALYISGIIMKK